MEMRNKSIKVNYIYNIINQVVLVLIPLITTPHLSKTLGANGIGEYSYSYSIVNYFILLAGLGTGNYGQREISYCQDCKNKRSLAFFEIESISVISALVSLILYYSIGFIGRFDSLYFIQSINILAVIFDITWLYQGMENFSDIVKRNILIKLLNVAFIFIFIRKAEDLLIYALGQGIFVLFGNVLLLKHLKSYVEISLSYIKLKWSRIRGAISMLLPNIAITIYTVVDKTMLGLLTVSKEQNGYYEQSLKLSKLTLTIVTSLVAVMIPRMGALYSKGEKERLHEYVYLSYRFVWLLGIPLYLGLVGISNNLIPWFLGSEFSEVNNLLPILGLLIIIIGISNVTGLQLLAPTQRQNSLTASVFMGAIINVILNIFLIPRYYARGAAIASVAAESSVAIFQFILVRREIKVVKLLNGTLKYWLGGILMFIVLHFESAHLPSSILNSLIMVMTGGVIYFLVLIITREEVFMNILYSVLKRRKY